MGRTPLCHDLKAYARALANARSRAKGEKTQKVPGYDGEAFRIVQRGGRTFHVYGSGEAHEVFELPHGKNPDATSGGTPAA